MSTIIHPASFSDILRTPIADCLRESGENGLAEDSVRIADWIEMVRWYVRIADIAGEELSKGDLLSRGPDELLYRSRSPIPYVCVLGVSKFDTCKGGMVSIVSTGYGEMIEIDETGLMRPRIDPEIHPVAFVNS